MHTASRDLAQKLKKSQASAEACTGGGAFEENGDDARRATRADYLVVVV